ncbi:MAG: ribulose-phosphate 3-epimerase [Lachnospiraceae bacterium]|nr:ribulose-phosphate 3-epimerase [Lachnospiraceae bacterium]
MKPIITASLMCMDFLDIRHQIDVIDEELDGYHADIMDGHFCKNMALSPDIIKAICSHAKKPVDVHMMTTNPSDWIDPLADAGVSIISPHAETINTDAYRILNKIKDRGCKTGITLNPATPLSFCKHYLGRIDVLTIMTVDVGFAGQPFVTEMLDKIREAIKLREENGWHYDIMVDGQCNDRTYKQLYDAGVERYIIGASGLFQLDPDIRTACQKAKTLFEEKTGVAVR